ncbi:MAG: HEAT repeat domain-containing protein [Kiritimatiellae bacterium]|nr:HEAT repeat domain-containing protein [Kiritimatiellia bacterium]
MLLVPLLLWALSATTALASVEEDLARLLPQLADANPATRGDARQLLRGITARASAPERGNERAELERALAARAGDRTLPAAVRIELMAQLETVGGSNCVPVLAAALTEPERELRDAARRALEVNPSAEAGAALRAALETTTDPLLRLGLVHSLGIRRDPAAMPLLVRALEDPATRAAAAAALGRLGGAPSLAALQRVATTGDAAIAAALVEGAARSGGAGRAALLRLSADATAPPALRAAAIATLIEREADPDEALRRMTTALTDASVQIRTAALAAAASRRGPALSAALVRAWNELPPDARAGAIDLLDESAKDFVAAQCRSDDPALAGRAIEAYARLAGGAALSALLEWASAETPLRRTAMRAIETLTGDSVRDDLLRAAVTGAPPRRAAALIALARRREAGAATVLAQALTDPEPAITRAAREGLRVVGGADQLEPLLRFAAQQEPDALNDLRAMLTRLRNDAAAGARLIALAQKSGTAERAAVAAVIGVVGGTNALTWLREQLEAPEPRLRTAATRALSEWSGPEALPLLRELVAKEDANETDRRLAARGIARLVLASTNAPAELRCDAALAALRAAREREDRLALIAALATVPDPRAATALREQLDQDPAARKEILLAMATLAETIGKRDRELARQLARQVLAASDAPDAARTKAEPLAR